MPKVDRSRLHLFRDSSPRVIKAVGLQRNGSEFERKRRGVVKNSLNWPSGLFDQLYGINGHRGVNHPKGLGGLEVLREDMEGWGKRCIF